MPILKWTPNADFGAEKRHDLARWHGGWAVKVAHGTRCRCGCVDVTAGDHVSSDGLMVAVHTLLVDCFSFRAQPQTTARNSTRSNEHDV